MKKINLTSTTGLITEEALQAIIKKATDVSCQCPGHLIQLLRSVQAFTEYQKNCINQTPQDVMVHQWLETTSMNLEHILSNTIITLARMEGMIDDQNQIVE